MTQPQLEHEACGLQLRPTDTLLTALCVRVLLLQGVAAMCGDACKPGALPGNILIYTLQHLGDTNWRTLCVSMCCCAFLFSFAFARRRFPDHRLLRVLPDVLAVTMVATFLSWTMDLSRHGVRVLGELEAGFIVPALPDLDQGAPSAMLSAAFTITILGFVETQMTNKKYASKHQVSSRSQAKPGCRAACLRSHFFLRSSFVLSLSLCTVRSTSFLPTESWSPWEWPA